MSRANIDPRLLKILEQYHDDPRSAVWNCHGVIVAYHRAIEQMAARAGITFDPPVVVEMNSDKRIAVVCVTGHMGDRSIWSFGEASPHNNKNSYPIAMAEKRAVDRVVLKLLGLHGEVYSQDEIDEEELEKEQKRRAMRSQHGDAPAATEAPDASTREEPEPAQQPPENPELKGSLIGQIHALANVSDLGVWAAKNVGLINELCDADRREVREAYTSRRSHLSQDAAA